MSLGARAGLVLAAALGIVGCQSLSDQSQSTLAALSADSSVQAAQIAEQATQLARQEDFITYLATRGPPRVTLPVGTIVATPYQPVTGHVSIQGSPCCLGGVAGDIVDLAVTFQASSPLGEVTEMRVRLGTHKFPAELMLEAEWVPYLTEASYPVQIALNWVGYDISVQFRDKDSNESPIYYDEIAVEGHPPATP